MRRRRLLVVAGGGLAALLAALLLLLPLWPAVTVSAQDDTIAVLSPDPFTIAYVHSIDGLPIEEDLTPREGELVVERTRLKQFGAGMGHIEGEGEGHSDGEWWVLDHMNREIGPQMNLRAGSPAVDHRLLSTDAELHLSSCLSGELISITAERVSGLTIALTRDRFDCTEPHPDRENPS